MVYMTARVFFLTVALAMATIVCAQEPELKVKPSGRILFDECYQMKAYKKAVAKRAKSKK